MTSRRYYIPAPMSSLASASGPTAPPSAAEPPHVPATVPDPAPWALPPPPGLTWSTPRLTPPPPAEPPAAGHERWWRRLPKPSLVAAVLALVAFVVKVSIWSKSTSNGVVTSCSYLDVGALALGGATIVLSVWGALTAVLQRRPGRFPVAIVLALSVVTLALGFVHVFRGIDLVLPQCPEIGSIDRPTATGF